MKNIIYRSLIALILLSLIIVVYLSTFGIKTDKFNSKIISQIKEIEPNIKIKLNEVGAKLSPFDFGLNLKTIGTNIIYRDKVIKLESIESNISIKSFLKEKFALTEVNISTKSLAIKDLISFIRLLNKNPKLFIAEQFVKNGYVVADLKIKFDESGNINKDYKIKGLVRDGSIALLKKYDLKKIDFIFEIEEEKFKFNDIKLILNNKNISIPKLITSKNDNKYLISGKINNENIKLNKSEIDNLIEKKLLGLDIKEIIFSSRSDFKFDLAQGYKIKNFEIKSDIDLNNLKLINSFRLKEFFPDIRDDILLKNQKIKLEYKKDNLNINGTGKILLQEEIDEIRYEVIKKKNKFEINTILSILENPFEIDLINYKKNKKKSLELIIKTTKEIKKDLVFNEISLKEKNNIISIKDLILSNDYKIDSVRSIDANYQDKENFQNKVNLLKKNNDYIISGSSFNINNIITSLLDSDNDKKSETFNKNLKLFIDIKKVHLDKKNFMKNLKGSLYLNNNEITKLNLQSRFSNKKNIKFTIKNNGIETITTLFSEDAKPLIERYKFIKGFNEGVLDFYSIKKNGKSKSTLKIYNFKLKELPVLTKVLTLASLQGIADLLSGEGIRFEEFEMNFTNDKKLMEINEIYAIGPAISILMDGYIQKNDLISLRGSLVPATTINKTIGSIPLLGNILVGKKAGEGVFGVSFKIKGPANNLETTVNPIKTLTPRFITRTLEKIKKN